MCGKIESACKGSGRECVCLESEGECRERERKRDGKCVHAVAERGKECVLK